MATPTPGVNPQENQTVPLPGLANGGAGLAQTTLANNGVTGPAAPVAGQQITTPAVASQTQLMQALQMQASGVGGPTLAQNQLQSGLAGSLGATLAAGAAGRGLQNPGVANKQIQENQVTANAQATGASAQTRAQGQLNAQTGLAGVQGQAEANAQAQASLNQQAALANQQAQEAYNQELYGLTSGNQQASNALLPTAISGITNIFGGAGQAISTIGKASSDEDVKTDITPADTETQDFLNTLNSSNEKVATGTTSDEDAKMDVKSGKPDTQKMLSALTANSYKYKDPSAPGSAPGTHFGPMAQELQKSKAGASTVERGPDGTLRVDGARLALVLASAAGDMHQRINKLEAALKTKKTKRA